MMFNVGDNGDHCFSAFYLLQQSCFEMADISHKVRTPKGEHIHQGFVSIRMMWGECIIKI